MATVSTLRIPTGTPLVAAGVTLGALALTVYTARLDRVSAPAGLRGLGYES